MAKGQAVSRKKVQSVLKSSTQHTDDIAARDVTTSAEVGFDKLVTAQSLLPSTEESIVLAEQSTDKDYNAALAFAEEIVEVTIAEDANEFPIDPVPLSCNGKQIFIPRGTPMRVPRKFVECLCNPISRVKTKQIKNSMNEDATVLEQTRSLQFPFQLTELNGSTPKTKAWLRSLLTRG